MIWNKNKLLCILIIAGMLVSISVLSGCTIQTDMNMLVMRRDHQQQIFNIYKKNNLNFGNEELIVEGEYPRWKPGDKTHFAYLEPSQSTPNYRLWVVEQDGSNPIALTDFVLGYDEYSFSWSGDGNWIVFSAGSGTNFHLYKVRADGSQQPERLTWDSGWASRPVCNPKTDQIAYVQDFERIYIIDLDGSSDPIEFIDHTYPDEFERDPVWDDTGENLACIAFRKSSPNQHVLDVYITIFEMQNYQIIDQYYLFESPGRPIWQGKYIFYTTPETLSCYNTKTHQNKVLFNDQYKIIYDNDLCADDAFVYFNWGGHIYSIFYPYGKYETINCGEGDFVHVWED